VPEAKQNAKGNQVVHDRKTRYEKLKDAKSNLINLPEIDELSYILDWTGEAGLYENGANGPMPLSWTEIKAWAELMGMLVAPWEAALIRELSTAYCSQYHKSSSPTEPPPYAELEIDRDSVSTRVLKLFRSHSKYRKKR